MNCRRRTQTRVSIHKDKADILFTPTTQDLDFHVLTLRVSARSEYSDAELKTGGLAVTVEPVLVSSCEVENNALCSRGPGMWHNRRNAPRI